MAQTNFTPISLYYSTTAAAVPTAGNLVAGELAINTQDGKLFYKDAAGVVQTLATKGGVGSSSTTQILYNSSGLVVGSANLTFNGTGITLGTTSTLTPTALDLNPASGNANISLREANVFRGYIEGNSGGMFFGTGAAATERMRINSSGAVVISGTAAIGAMLNVYSPDNSTNCITTQVFTNGNTAIGFRNAGSSQVGSIVTNSGDVAYNTTSSSTTGAVLLSNGVQFPATQSASANANTLDDYEEGTWTATVTPTTSGSISLASGLGWYVKVGNLVTVGTNIFVSSVSSPVGTIQIGGLPFTSVNSIYKRPAVAASGLVLTSFAGPVSGQIDSNSTTSILVANDQGNWANTIQANSQIQFMASYVVS